MEIKQICAEHRPAMVAACHRVLKNEIDAGNVADEAIAKVVATPPQEEPNCWRSWLCTVAKNTAKDFVRRNVSVEKLRDKLSSRASVPAADAMRQVQLGLDTQRLVDRIGEFLKEDKRRDFEHLCVVELTSITRKELAEKLGLRYQTLKRRLTRVVPEVRRVALAVCLLDSRECEELWQDAGGRPGSPALLARIEAHADTCARCEKEQRNPSRLPRYVLAGAGLGLTAGLLARVMRIVTNTKVVAAATATAAGTTLAVVLFTGGADTTRREPSGLPELWTPTPSATGSAVPPPAPPAQPPAPGPAERTSEVPPAPPPQEPASVPPSGGPVPVTTAPRATTSTSVPGDGGRDASPPVVTDGWSEREKIATAWHGKCGDEPTTSRVRATITAPGGVVAATVVLRGRGRSLEFPMSRAAGTTTWSTEVGPVEGWEFAGRYEVLVVAVGANGVPRAVPIGTLCVFACQAEPGRVGGGTR